MAIETGTDTVKRGLAQMFKVGVIMDVVTPEHAKIAEEAGACAVMALERVPADIRAPAASPACPTRRSSCGSCHAPAQCAVRQRSGSTPP